MMSFDSVSVLLPVIDEAKSLQKTIDIIEKKSSKDIKEYIVIICQKTTKEVLACCEPYKRLLGGRLRIIEQKRPFSGGAVLDGFDISQGSHVLMMASDLETHPNDVPKFIREAKKNPKSVVTASRWLEKNSFQKGYGLIKFCGNFIFQKIFSFLYRTHLTDMTFGYTLLPTHIAQSIKWEELKHPLFMETTIKPLKLGIDVIEIPCSWQSRVEGKSHFSILTYLGYFKVGLKVKFSSKEQMLRSH